MLRRLLGEPITISTDLGDPLNLVLGDATQLEHLLINLSVNARDAMPQGGTLVIATRNIDLDAAFVITHPGARPGSYVAMSVTDTGQGMDSQTKAKIFEPFFTTKERGRGTGLGLAAVYGTVKQLNGYIDVTSEPGHGSAFSIYLPRTVQEPPVHQARSLTTSPPGHETILLVEDEKGVRAFVKVTLQRFGYRVLESGTAEEALTLIQTYDGPIHLLLTDVILPRMDGRKLAQHATQHRPQLHVLFMSGYADRLGTIEGFLEQGVQLLEKPFSAQALLTKTREVLGMAPTAAIS
jgi:CheY-like chemotaxis protein